jgi:hypothetical protein
MSYVPTTTISILRTPANTVNAWGDPIDTLDVAHAGIPASISETTRRLFGGSQSQDRVVRYATCHVYKGTDVLDNDRVKDDTTGDIYIVDIVRQNSSQVHASDVVLELRRTT